MMSQLNPYQPSSNPFADQHAYSAIDQQAIEAAAKKLLRDKHDHTTSWQLLVSGILGCVSPVLAIYGIVFLLRRPYSFPLKGLAIAGTVLHCVWTLLIVVAIVLNILTH